MLVDRVLLPGLIFRLFLSQKKGQYYSILLIFTNGGPADTEKTLSALQEASDAPLSIVVVGVGEGSFAGMQQLENEHKESCKRDNLRFVQYEALKGDEDKLSEAAMARIPAQLETYFASRYIFPTTTERTRRNCC